MDNVNTPIPVIAVGIALGGLILTSSRGLRQDMTQMESRLRQEMTQMESRLRQEMMQMEARLHQEMSRLREAITGRTTS